MIDEVADATEQVSSESGNVSAAAQQQASSLTKISQNTQTLSDQADDLQEMLSQFTINEEAVKGAEKDAVAQQASVQAGFDGGSSPRDGSSSLDADGRNNQVYGEGGPDNLTPDDF
jgi:hypothetical protein